MMSQSLGHLLPGVDPEVDRLIDELLDDPKSFFDRARAEELQDVRAETAQRRQALEAEQIERGKRPAEAEAGQETQASVVERFVSLLHRIRDSRQN
jgi:hypothetical protein